MQVAGPLDLEVLVDPDADPVDFDEALLTFIERVVERRLSRKPTAPVRSPGTELSIYLPPE